MIIVGKELSSFPRSRKSIIESSVSKLNQSSFGYCIHGYFHGGFISTNFASQNLMKISTSIYVYL